MTTSNSIHAILKTATRKLTSTPATLLDAETLLAFVLKKPRSYLFTWPDHILTPEQLQIYTHLLERRGQGEPVAYITGSREFWSLLFQVTPATLIPRPETELLVETALTKCKTLHQPHILDLGTGSGCIAIAIAHERPDAHITAIDYSSETLEIAKTNATQLKTPNIRFILSNWFQALTNEKFDLILANPPYIASNDTHLKQGDLRFEPTRALTSGIDGLQDIRRITAESHHHLNTHGILLLEIGYNQAEAVRTCLQTNGFTDIGFIQDYSGHWRVCTACASPNEGGQVSVR